MSDFITKNKDLLIGIGMIVLIFCVGFWSGKHEALKGARIDTTYVNVAPPPAITHIEIPGAVVTKIVYRDRTDSTAIYESAWLQNENATLHAQLDTLLADKDSLKTRLEVLLAPHQAVQSFSFSLLDGKGHLNGNAALAYVPMKEQFGLTLTPTELYLPEITKTKFPPVWAAPALFAGGGSTAYFIQQKNSTGALISGGASLLLYLLEF
jgi:hypothetical protein